MVAYRNSKPFNNQCGRRGDQRRRVMYRIQRLHKNARIARSRKRHICLTKLNSENTFQYKLPGPQNLGKSSQKLVAVIIMTRLLTSHQSEVKDDEDDEGRVEDS